MPRPKPKPAYASPEDRERLVGDADYMLTVITPGHCNVWEAVAQVTLDLDNRDAFAAIRRWRQEHKLHGSIEDQIWVARAYLRRERRLKEQAERKLPKPVRTRREFRAFKKLWNHRVRQPRATWPLIGEL
jgi:hypothetical protein